MMAMTPIAPAALALLTAVPLPHAPVNSKTAMLPATLLIGAHAVWAPSVVLVASTAVPVRSKLRGPRMNASVAGVWVAVVSSVLLAPDHRNMFMIGDRPSDGVAMLALSREPLSAADWARAISGSPPTPPRPKLSVCALPVASVKPES